MIIPVILSGGAGTRLWPVSRAGHPKPFMKLADGESLLAKTYRRASTVLNTLSDGEGRILTVTNRDYYFMSKDELDVAKLSPKPSSTFLLEPEGRNTAPAIGLAARCVYELHGPETVMLVMPSDHLIQKESDFIDSVARAMELAQQQYLVTFGIVPSGPETGFGYIEAGEEVLRGRKAVRFVEKPSLEKARDYLESGNFYWNSGMFCFQAGAFLDGLQRYAPEVSEAIDQCWDALPVEARNEGMLDIPADSFSKAPDISIDYALMERSERVVTVPSEFGWSDVGSWCAVKEQVSADPMNNRVIGDTVLVECNNTFVQSEDRLVAAIGVSDLLIVDTPDALLVSHESRSQDVKKVVEKLKLSGHEAYKLHKTVVRPWGSYTILEEAPRFKIKRIEVKPGASLSLQMHHHRSEHWVVVSGTARVINGDQEILLGPNESTYIPAGHKHRLENPGVLDLVMIEVQSGEYLGEDDIVRFEDRYGRA